MIVNYSGIFRIFAIEIATLLTLGIIETSFILPSLNRSVAP